MLGGGLVTVPFLKQTFPKSEIYVINIDKTALQKVKKYNVKTYYCDAQNMKPFPSNYFDFIYAGQLIEHLFYPEKFLRESYRVLKKNGIMIMETPNLACWYNRLLLLFGYRPSNYTPCSEFYDLGIPKFFNKSQRQHHPSVFTRRMLVALLNRISFRVLDSKVVNSTYENQPFKKIRFLLNYLIPENWKENIIIKAKK